MAGKQYADNQNKKSLLENIFISFRVIVLQSGPEFLPKYLQKEGANNIARELFEEENNKEQNMNKVTYTQKRYLGNLFNKPRLSWSDPK